MTGFQLFWVDRDGCHMWGRKCSLLLEHLISLPLGVHDFAHSLYIHYRIWMFSDLNLVKLDVFRFKSDLSQVGCLYFNIQFISPAFRQLYTPPLECKYHLPIPSIRIGSPLPLHAQILGSGGLQI